MYQNRVHFIGYVGKNPEAKTAKQSQRKYTVFSLATMRAWNGADEEWHSKTEWHRIIAWNGLGEYAAVKLRKGDQMRTSSLAQDVGGFMRAAVPRRGNSGDSMIRIRDCDEW
jgi:single-stranded DNA-binding protein